MDFWSIYLYFFYDLRVYMTYIKSPLLFNRSKSFIHSREEEGIQYIMNKSSLERTNERMKECMIESMN